MARWRPPESAGPDVSDLSDDLRRIFQELDRQAQRPPSAAAGQCSPTLDVLETDETVEVVIDVPGVAATSVRVLLKGGVVLVAGEKLSMPPAGIDAGDFHLVERSFGRFARAVRITAAFDGARATAHLAAGELRIVLPRIHDRRGQARAIEVTTGIPDNGRV
jgi:HSP20 family protein